MENNVLDIIICFVESYKNETKEWSPNIQSSYKDKKYFIWNTHYLLGQILRQVNIPEDYILLSKGAKEKWEQLSPVGKNGSDITNYYYRESLIANCKEPVEVQEYKGSESKGEKRTITNGETFIFRDIFHLEHTIPINVIIDELLKLSNENNLNYDSVSSVLNKMYICRMLKEEDRKSIDPKHKSKRSIEIETVLKEVYKVDEPNGIKIINH